MAALVPAADFFGALHVEDSSKGKLLTGLYRDSAGFPDTAKARKNRPGRDGHARRRKLDKNFANIRRALRTPRFDEAKLTSTAGPRPSKSGWSNNNRSKMNS